MKIFIVFAGLLLVNMCIISYQGDFARFMHLQRSLDEIAFECAEIAAADAEDALAFAEGMLNHTAGLLRGVKVRGYTCDISEDGDYATVRVRLDVEGLFKFPFMTGIRIIAERRHELIP